MVFAAGIFFVFLLLACQSAINGIGEHHSSKRDVGRQCGAFDSNQNARVQGMPGKRGEKGEEAAVDYGKVYKKIDKRLESSEFELKIQSMIQEKLDLGSDLQRMTRTMDDKIGEKLESSEFELKIQSMIQKKLNSALQSMTRRMDERYDELEEKIDELRTSFSDSISKLEKCQMRYKGVCYWFIVQDMPYEQGRALCKYEGGDAGFIQDEVHFAWVMSHIRAMIPKSRSFSRFYLGMRIVPKTSVVTATITGRPVPYLQWYPNHPLKDSGRTAMYVLVRKVANAVDQGMFNTLPKWPQHGILCQM